MNIVSGGSGGPKTSTDVLNMRNQEIIKSEVETVLLTQRNVL